LPRGWATARGFCGFCGRLNNSVISSGDNPIRENVLEIDLNSLEFVTSERTSSRSLISSSFCNLTKSARTSLTDLFFGLGMKFSKRFWAEPN